MSNAKPTDWKTEDIPPQRMTILLDRTYSPEEMARIQTGLVPEQMEDKWFIYWKDGALFFHRSWTGFCIYIARFADEGDGWKMLQADVNRDPEQYTGMSGERDAEMISYLVDVLLLHRNAAFPSNELSSEKSALMNWSQVGRAMLGQHPNGDGTAQQDSPADADKPRR